MTQRVLITGSAGRLGRAATAALTAHGLIKVRVQSDDRTGREEMFRSLAEDLDAPGALAVIDRWAEETRVRSGAAGAEDLDAGALVRVVAGALLGVRI